ncbi:MAG: hypothetical protein HY823_04245 [Acidobacteria bacterium]|nr:hypothetical protein [Acidobacteriota bacterium]
MAWLWLLPAGAALYALHRLALWAEGRGWIYYRRARGGGAMAGILQDIETHVQPRVEHVRQARERLTEGREDREPGGGPDKLVP